MDTLIREEQFLEMYKGHLICLVEFCLMSRQ